MEFDFKQLRERLEKAPNFPANISDILHDLTYIVQVLEERVDTLEGTVAALEYEREDKA